MTILSVSLDIGCVRLTERFLRGDPPTADEVSAAVSAIDRELDRAAREIPLLADAGGSARLSDWPEPSRRWPAWSWA